MEPRIFKIRMPLAYQILLYALAFIAAGATAWFIRGGMYSAAAVMAIVFIPLLALYFYFLVVLPGRARIILGPGRMALEARPFLDDVIERDAIEAAHVASIRKDQRLTPVDKKNGVSVRSYRLGIQTLPGDKEGRFAAASDRALYIAAGGRHYLLAPGDFDEFVDTFSQAMETNVPDKS